MLIPIKYAFSEGTHLYYHFKLVVIILCNFMLSFPHSVYSFSYKIKGYGVCSYMNCQSKNFIWGSNFLLNKF